MSSATSIEAQYSKKNFQSFLWHSSFLALASNFMDVDTIIPAMMLNLGANAWQLGLLTAIMVGASSLMQLVFSMMVAHVPFKKKLIILGINLRIVSLIFIALLFKYQGFIDDKGIIMLFLFIFISLFAFSGSFSNVSYIDLLGKSILPSERKRFFSLKQSMNSIGLFISSLAAGYILNQSTYPNNYFLLFAFAAILLSMASGGFYMLRERVASAVVKLNPLDYLKQLPKELRKNQNLKLYLIVLNLLGIGLSLMPFVILLVKQTTGLSVLALSTFVVSRTLGMLFGSLILFTFKNRFKYQKVLTIDAILGASLPILALIIPEKEWYFTALFFISGLFVSTYKVSMDGLLIEISGNHNRTLYAGLSGVGNLIPALFPIMVGAFIQTTGFTPIFVLIAVLMLSSFFFIRKFQCHKTQDNS